MLSTLIGIVLLFAPLLIMFLVRDKHLGVLYGIAYGIAFELFVAVLTQALGIFSYSVVVAIHAIAVGVLLYAVGKQKNWLSVYQRPIIKRVDWVLVAVVLLAALFLSRVHHGYIGSYSTVPSHEYLETASLTYTYPYFSDEWYAVALANEAIRSKSLPLANPLIPQNPPFVNFEFAFHAFIAELVVLLNLDALTDYVKLSVGVNTMLILVLYLFLRSLHTSPLAAAGGSLSALFITSGANLPGIWNLIPITMGIMTLVLGLAFIKLEKRTMTLLLAFLTLLFYPPLVIFYLLALVYEALTKKRYTNFQNWEPVIDYGLVALFSGLLLLTINAVAYSALLDAFFYTVFSRFIFIVYAIIALLVIAHARVSIADSRGKKLLYGVIAVALGLVIVALALNTTTVRDATFIQRFIHYTSFTAGALPSYIVWHVASLPVLLLACIGLPHTLKAYRGLLILTATGLLFWFFYATSTTRFLIDYQRIVYVVAIFFSLLAAFGIHYLYSLLPKRAHATLKKMLPVAILAFFLFLLPHYTQRMSWQKLTLHSIASEDVFLPAAPANRYLHPDDLTVFQDLHEERFLSHPWKGTVLGVATDNFPATTKPGTITVNEGLYPLFQSIPCNEKLTLVKRFEITYVYTTPLDCGQFQPITTSAEGIGLYKVL